MITEGDYFVVSRGFEYGRGLSDPFCASFFGTTTQQKEEKPQYDRGLGEIIFLCLAVEGQTIVALGVYSPSTDKYKQAHIGKRDLLNLNEIEIQIIADSFVAALGINPKDLRRTVQEAAAKAMGSI